MAFAQAFAHASSAKLLKSAVEYESPAHGPHHCSECVHYESGQCAIVAGSIKPADWCNKWEAR